MTKVLTKLLLLSLLVAATMLSGNYAQAQQVDVAKSVSNATPDVGQNFDFILDCNCIGTTTHCDNVVLTDTLPGTVEFLSADAPAGASVSYDQNSHTITVTFSDPNATNGIDAGNSKQIVVNVFFPDGSLTGSTADNTAYISSSNAGDDNDSALATAQNGHTSYAEVRTTKSFASGGSDDVIGGTISYNIQHGSLGLYEVENYSVYDTLPPQFGLTQINNSDFSGTNLDIRVFYQTNQSPGVWVEWTNGGDPSIQLLLRQQCKSQQSRIERQ